jgi:acyl carrier protein
MSANNLREVLLEEIGKIAPEVAGTSVDPDANLREAFDLDSMDFLNLISAIHQRLGVDIPEADYARLSSLNGVAAYLAERKPAA